MAKTKKVTKQEKKKDDIFRLSVKVLGRYHKAEGKTFDEALDKLDLKNAKGYSVWTMEHGERKVEKVISPIITQRLFGLAGLAKDIAYKQFVGRFI